MDDGAIAWPTEDEEGPTPASTEEAEAAEPSNGAHDEVDETSTDTSSEPTEPTEPTEPADDLSPAKETEPWMLPIRAAPILALQGEEVVEFPLSQRRDGRESTSLVMDDEVMRIVEARLDDDGIRRLNVRMALVKEHISGYSHTHLNLFQKLQNVWLGSIGAGLLMTAFLSQGLVALGGGGLFVFAGIAGLIMAQMDLHRLSFSDHGGRHDFYLSGWKQEPFLIHNSTALLGPAFVDFLRTSTLDTTHIDAVVERMRPLTPPPQALPPPETVPQIAASPSALPPPSLASPMVTSGPPISAEAPNPTPPPLPAPSSNAEIPVMPPPPVGEIPMLPPPPAGETPMLPPPPVAIPTQPSLPPAPLPPAPLPPAPLPPIDSPVSKAQMDEDALWDDLN